MIIRHGRAVSQGKQGLFWGGAAGGLPSPSSLTRVHLPQRGRQDLALRKLLAAHILGSPFGGAGAVRRLRGPPPALLYSPWEGPLAPRPLRPLRGHLPQRGRRDLALRKLLAAHILGSPSGGRYVPVGRCPAADRGGSRDAGTALAVTERARRWLAAQLPESHLLGAPPAGKGGAKPLFP